MIDDGDMSKNQKSLENIFRFCVLCDLACLADELGCGHAPIVELAQSLQEAARAVRVQIMVLVRLLQKQ